MAYILDKMCGRRSPKTIAAWDDVETVIRRYVEGEDIPAIAKSYNVSIRPIRLMLQRNSIRIRPHSEWSQHKVNRDYFAKIDSHEKAQILGFIYADGCVAENKDSYKLIIQLHEKDRDYLEYIKKALGYTGSIRRVKGRVAYHEALVIHSKKLCIDLIKLGAMPRKTFQLNFPTTEQVPSEYVSSFILGFFEGDGSINTHRCFQGAKEKKWYERARIHLVGRLNMMEAIKSRYHLTNKIETKGNVYGLTFVKLDRVKAFLNDIYQSVPFVMRRKYLRAKHLLNNQRFD